MSMTVANFVRLRDAGGKFVVLVHRAGGGDGIVVFSDFTQDAQHERVLARWRATSGGQAASPDMRVAGGGWWRYDGKAGRLELYGASAAYGPFDRKRLAEGIVAGSVFGEGEILFS